MASMDVKFSMVSNRPGVGESYRGYDVREDISFDGDTYLSRSGEKIPSHRSASTQGRMFGLSFWEDW